MSKRLEIRITSEGKTGRIDIIGSISEWNANNASDFRLKCAELKDGGVSGCLVYLMTSGGDCFQASEIVNILNETFGSYTAEGGALVASAGTYIAVRATSFTLASNGQMMIHKPAGWADGNESEMENTLKLLKNITKDYYKTYVSKLKKPESEFKTKWEAGDFWMTAQEALEWGFVSAIKSTPADIDAETAGVIRACGSPYAVSISNNNNNKQTKMKNLVTLLIAAFALENVTSDSSEAEVVAALQGKFKPLNDEIARLEGEAKAVQDGAIKALLDDAQASGKIVAVAGKTVQEVRTTYENIGKKTGIESLRTILSGVPVPGSILSQIQNGKPGGAASGEFKTLDALLAKGVEFVATFKKDNYNEYEKLFVAEFGRKPVN
jgi:ATP-dependent protease ClpP protease subunit